MRVIFANFTHTCSSRLLFIVAVISWRRVAHSRSSPMHATLTSPCRVGVEGFRLRES